MNFLILNFTGVILNRLGTWWNNFDDLLTWDAGDDFDMLGVGADGEFELGGFSITRHLAGGHRL